MAEEDDLVRLRTSTGVIVRVHRDLAALLEGSGYKRVGGGAARRRADTGAVPAQQPASAPQVPSSEPPVTTAQLEQQLRARRSRTGDQH